MPILSKNLFFLFLGTFFFQVDSMLLAQNNIAERNGFRILTHPTQLLLRDFQLSLEKVKNRYNFGITLGYRPSFKEGGEVTTGPGFGYSSSNFLNGLYEAITIGVNGRIYNQYEPYFFETEIFYRHWWFDNKKARFEGIESNIFDFDGIRTERVKVIGCKFLVGYTFEFFAYSEHSCALDVFCGLGIRNRDLWYKTTTINEDNSTESTTIYSNKYWFPSLQLGCKIGYQYIR